MLAGPVLQASIYLLCLPALIVCAVFGGPASVVTATLALAVAGFGLDGATDLSLVQRALRALLFAASGISLAWAVTRLRRPHLAPAPPPTDRAGALHARLTSAWNEAAVSEMASVLAHELNQPLSALTNYLRAARTMVARLELTDDTLIEAVSRAGDQAVRAGEVVRSMRDLAARGGTQLQPESLAGIIREIEFVLELMAREAGVTISFDLYRGEDVVQADRIQIQQLIINLVRNAIEAMGKCPEGLLRLTTCLDVDKNMITTVEDNGPGVDPEVLKRPFLPHLSTGPHRRGLGLSICSAIVENHKGRLFVESSTQGGAAFRFVLPRVGGNDRGLERAVGLRRRR